MRHCIEFSVGPIPLVKNVSKTNFASGHSTVRTEIAEAWTNVLKRKKVFHVRIILNWGGFTAQQLALAEKFTEEQFVQPLFLIYPTATTGSAIYGPAVFERLKQRLELPSRPKRIQANKISDEDLEFMNMDLQPEENWKEYLQELE